jgi:hypothetical protein
MVLDSSIADRGQVTNDDHGPTIIISAGIMLGSMVMVVAMRLHQRWPWSRMLKVEDGILLAAVVSDMQWNIGGPRAGIDNRVEQAAEIAHVTTIALAVHAGLGKMAHSVSLDNVDSARRVRSDRSNYSSDAGALSLTLDTRQ